MSKKVTIGIDLGTTNSCVAVYRNRKVEIISNESGNALTPSYVAFDEGVVYVGKAAKILSGNKPKQSVFEVKRLIGRKFTDATVQNDMQYWPFEVIEDNGAPKIKVQHGKEEMKLFTPEEISAHILSKLKKCAETYIGTMIKDAVITVPAYFSDSQRQATIDAGEIAGLNVVSILNEPTAAALAYGVDKQLMDNQTVLVFDFGGGTFDVSILSKAGNEFVVIAVGGDTHLGGGDIDMRLVDHFSMIAKDKYQKDISQNPKYFRRLRKSCEEAKMFLSTQTGLTCEVTVHGMLDGEDFQETLSRAKFEHLNKDLLEKVIDHVRNVLDDAGMNKSDIDEVILVGGSSRIPKIQEMLSTFFGGKKLNSTINPDEAVAYGAAVKAALASGEHTIEEIKLKEVVPLSLGQSDAWGDMITFIKRNSRIPTTAVQKDWTTIKDYQSSVLVRVFEGERERAENNNLLGTFVIDIGEKEKAGVPRISFTFEVDVNGILHVSAVNEKTNCRGGITISTNKGRLNKGDIERMVQEVKQLKIT